MNLPLTLAGISKVVAEVNKPYRDGKQIEVAKILFRWWWHTGISEGSIATRPEWEACAEHIQAFWMDGAWRALNVSLMIVQMPEEEE